MAVTASDLTQPTGRLKQSYFPEDDAADFAARLAAYIAAGVVKSGDSDPGTEAWAYHLAYSDICDDMSRASGSWSLEGQGSRSVTDDQRTRFCQLASQYRSEFDALQASLDAAAPSLARSQAVAIGYGW